MNASNAFRSHLMQQFVAAARTQSRPPLALIGLTKEEESRAPTRSSTTAQTSPLTRHYSTTRGSGSSNSSSHRLLLRTSLSPTASPSRSPSAAAAYPPIGDQQRRLLNTPLAVDEQNASNQADDEGATVNQQVQLPALFQDLLRTRRTSSRFAPLAPPSLRDLSDDPHGVVRDQAYWKQALDRAVECGLNAPNHKRTEPFRFLRMLAPSESTQRLAEIAYQVNLRKPKQASTSARNELEQAAARKRDKWSQIPAFLVTLVESSPDTTFLAATDVEAVAAANEEDVSAAFLEGSYDPLPYVAPQTERELEDYAAACAAVQNILLSLHAEQIASKWVTGSVVQTTAFRELVQAGPNDRVVALIMVGEPHAPMRPRRRRRHKPMEEVLQDLD